MQKTNKNGKPKSLLHPPTWMTEEDSVSKKKKKEPRGERVPRGLLPTHVVRKGFYRGKRRTRS